MTDKKLLHVLVIDDNEHECFMVKRALESADFADIRINTDLAHDVAGGVANYSMGSHGCIILDYRMDELDGLDFLAAFSNMLEDMPPVIMLSGIEDEKVKQQALEHGVRAFVFKDFECDFLKTLPQLVNDLSQRYGLS